MSTITIPQPELTTEDVSAALRKGLGPRCQVLPGMRTSLLPGAPDPGWPDSIVVGTGAGRVFRAQLEIDHRGGGTRVRVAPGASVSSRSPGRGPYPRQSRTACTSSPARLSARSCRMWLTT